MDGRSTEFAELAWDEGIEQSLNDELNESEEELSAKIVLTGTGDEDKDTVGESESLPLRAWKAFNMLTVPSSESLIP